eukprot:g25610.t1
MQNIWHFSRSQLKPLKASLQQLGQDSLLHYFLRPRAWASLRLHSDTWRIGLFAMMMPGKLLQRQRLLCWKKSP